MCCSQLLIHSCNLLPQSLQLFLALLLSRLRLLHTHKHSQGKGIMGKAKKASQG